MAFLAKALRVLGIVRSPVAGAESGRRCGQGGGWEEVQNLVGCRGRGNSGF